MLLTIVDTLEWEVAGGLLLNYDLLADLLLRLEARHGQYVTHLGRVWIDVVERTLGGSTSAV